MQAFSSAKNPFSSPPPPLFSFSEGEEGPRPASLSPAPLGQLVSQEKRITRRSEGAMEQEDLDLGEPY